MGFAIKRVYNKFGIRVYIFLWVSKWSQEPTLTACYILLSSGDFPCYTWLVLVVILIFLVSLVWITRGKDQELA